MHSEAGNLGRQLLSFDGISQGGGSLWVFQEDIEEAVAVLSRFVFREQRDGGLGGAAGIKIGEFFDGESLDVIGLAFTGELFECCDGCFSAEVP